METKVYYKHISALKGIACFFVMIGHISYIIKGTSYTNFNLHYYWLLLTSPLGLFQDEKFWLILFYISSGFLLSQKQICSLKDLVFKLINRFFRLGVPIFFCCCVIYVILLLVEPHNNQLHHLFENEWLQMEYQQELYLKDVFLSPFHVLLIGKYPFNSSYWMLREFLLHSWLVYIVLYLENKLSKNKGIVFFIEISFLLAGLAFSYSGRSHQTFPFALGMVAALHQSEINRFLSRYRTAVFVFPVISMLLYCLLPINIMKSLVFFSVVICTPHCSAVVSFLKSKFFMFLGKINFGIYSFHTPVLCTVGTWIILVLEVKLGFWLAYAAAAVSVIVITLILAVIYTATLEKLSSRIVSFISDIFSLILSKICFAFTSLTKT